MQITLIVQNVPEVKYATEWMCVYQINIPESIE